MLDQSNPKGLFKSCQYLVSNGFHEHGIEIPFPQRDLHLKSVAGVSDPEALKAFFKVNDQGI